MTFLKSRFLSLSKILIVTGLSFTVLLQSCSDDENPDEDTQVPEISFTTLTNNAIVKNVVTVNITLTDGTAEVVELYLGDDLLTILTDAPFTYQWNTNDLDDNTYTLKAVAINPVGNSSSQIQVHVKNVLLRVTIPNDLLWNSDGSTERGFLMLSDDEGELITYEEFENGDEIELRSADFNGDMFYVTEVRYEEYEEEGESAAYTIGGIPRGTTWKMLSYYNEDEDYAGEATLNVISYPTVNPPVYYRLFSHGDETSTSADATETIRLQSNNSKLYVSRYNDYVQQPVSYNTFDISAGATTTINLATVNKPLTSGAGDMPNGVDNFEYTLFGLTDNATKEILVFDYYGESEDFTYYYPGTAFGAYKSTILFDKDNYYYERSSVEKKFEIKMLTHEASFELDGGVLTYEATGDFDMTLFNSFGETVYRVFILAPGSGTIPELEFPEAIESLMSSPGEVEYSYSLIHVGATIENSADLAELITSEEGLPAFLDNSQEIIQVEYDLNQESGGRGKSLRYKPHFLKHNIAGK